MGIKHFKTKNKILAGLIGLMLVLCSAFAISFILPNDSSEIQETETVATPSGNWSDYAATSYASGSGDGSTEANAILIETPAQLALLAKQVNDATCLVSGVSLYPTAPTALVNGCNKVYVKLIADIDLSGHYWTPIGDDTIGTISGRIVVYYRFRGSFDGAGHKIDYLVTLESDGTSASNNRGLFGYVANTTIKNLTLGENSKIYGYDYVGGFVGSRQSGLTIENSVNNASVSGHDCVGGFIGQGGTITNSVNNGNIFGSNYVGGLCGNVGTITNSVNNGNVSGSVLSSGYIGGFIGGGSTFTAIVANSVNNGNVSGRGYVGGFVGTIKTLTITNSHSNCEVVSAGAYAGGLVGYVGRTGTSITAVNCFVRGSVQGTYAVGGLVGEGYALNITNSHSNCEVVSTGACVGGLVGQVSTSITATNCFVKGSVQGTSSVGGLVGTIGTSSSTKSLKIDNCFFDGDIVATRSGAGNVGALVGECYINNSSTITNVYAKGTITATNATSGLGVNPLSGAGVNDAFENYYYMLSINAPKLSRVGVESDIAHATCDAFFYDSGILGGEVTLRGLFWLGQVIEKQTDINSKLSAQLSSFESSYPTVMETPSIILPETLTVSGLSRGEIALIVLGSILGIIALASGVLIGIFKRKQTA